jgi:hypothetical protein
MAVPYKRYQTLNNIERVVRAETCPSKMISENHNQKTKEQHSPLVGSSKSKIDELVTSSQAMLTLLFSSLILLPLPPILKYLTPKIPSSFIVSIVLNLFASGLSPAAALATHYTTQSHTVNVLMSV